MSDSISIPIESTMGGAGNAGANDSPSSTGEFSSLIPEAYRDKPYMQGIDSHEKLFQQFDNAQALIGKKTVGIPTEDSNEEDWEKFYNQMGRPETHDKYEFDKTEFPEGLSRLEDTDNQAKELFHKAGLSAKQAKMVMKGYDNILKNQWASIQEKNEAQANEMNQEFEGMLDKHFGDQKEVVASRVNKLISENVPEEFKSHVLSLDNKNLMVLSSVLNSVHKKYIGEDTDLGGGNSVPLQTIEDMRTKGKELMATPEYRDPMHPNHEATKQKIAEIYQRIDRVRSRK